MQLHYIANASVPSLSGKTIPVVDPSDGQQYDEIQRGNAEDIDHAVQAARLCFNNVWGKMAPVDRSRLLMKLSAKVLQHADELATIEQRDCGKPTKQAKADAVALARYFEFYAGACDKLHGETIPYPQEFSVLTWREPHGVTGHIVPWNYPMQIFGRCVGGALAAGNTCVVKPSEDACLSLIRVAKRLRSGQVFINNYGAAGGVELPFGGVKSSGHGREKGFEALYGFTTLKTVAIRHG